MSNQTSEFVKIIKEICGEEGISLTSFSSDFMFCLKKKYKYKLYFWLSIWIKLC